MGPSIKMKLYIAITIAAFAISAEALSCPEEDVSLGMDHYIDAVHHVSSWENCGQICNLTDNCEYWTWGEEGDHADICFLYSTNSGLSAYPLSYSGEKGCPEKIECLK